MRLHRATVVITDGESYRMREVRHRLEERQANRKPTRGEDLYPATSGDINMAVDTAQGATIGFWR